MDSLLRGLTGYWPLYEASGTRANILKPGTDDLDSNVVTDPGQAASGKIQHALQGSGANGKRTAGVPTLNSLYRNDWAVSMWFKHTGDDGHLVGQWWDINIRRWDIDVGAAVVGLTVSTDGNNPAASISGPIMASEWNHFVAMYDYGRQFLELWTNGLRATPVVFAGLLFLGTSPLSIGAVIAAGATHPTNAPMCELGIWNGRMLNQREIVEGLWNRGRGSTYPFNALRTPVRGHEGALGRRRTRFQHAMEM